MDEWASPWADPTPTSPSAKPPQHAQHKPHTPWDEDDGAVWSADAPEEWEEEDGKHMTGKEGGDGKAVKRMESSGSLGWGEKPDAWGKEHEEEGALKLPGITLNRKISVPDWGSMPEVEETKEESLRLPDRMLGRKMSVPDWGDVEEAHEPEVVGTKPEKQQPTLQHKMSADWGEEDKVAVLEIPGVLRHKMSVPDWGAVEEEPEDTNIPVPVQTLKHQPSMPDWGAMEDVVEQKPNAEAKKVEEPVMGSLKHQPSVPDWGAVEAPVEPELAVEITHPDGPVDGTRTLEHQPSMPNWGAVGEEVAETVEVKPVVETGKVEGPASWEHHSEESWGKDEEHFGTDESLGNGSKAEEEKPVEAPANIEVKASTNEELVGSPAEEPAQAPEKQDVLDVEALPDVLKVSETLPPTPVTQEDEFSPPVVVEAATATKETEEEEDDDDDFGDFAEEDSETSDFPTSPVVAGPPTLHDIQPASHDIPPLPIDFNLINKLYPIPTSAPTAPPLESYIIHSTSA